MGAAAEIRPQEGPQEEFLSTAADIAVYGGAAGGGKSFALLLEPLRHMDNPHFTGVIFRRETPQIINPGGMWGESVKLYGQFDMQPNRQLLSWRTDKCAEFMKFSHLQYEDDVLNWQGSQLTYIGFDELTHFTESQFFYMMSRNRSMAGVPGYMRATCNPDPDSWVAKFLEWWIDQDTGIPIPERAGVLRWFIRNGDEMIWADTREELWDDLQSDVPEDERLIPTSVTFIPAKVTDNKILLKKDPAYLARLRALSRVDRARLEGGNWKIRPKAGEMFQTDWFEVVDALPTNIVREIRYWDRAATEPHEGNKNPDWTVGVKLVRDGYGTFYVADVVRVRKTPLEVKKTIRNTATQDGFSCKVGIEQDPGQAGKAEADDLVRFLAGFIVEAYPVTKAKETRAKPFSAQVQAGNVKVLRAPWNRAFFSELENFPSDSETAKDDQVDASAGGFNAMMTGRHVLSAMSKM